MGKSCLEIRFKRAPSRSEGQGFNRRNFRPFIPPSSLLRYRRRVLTREPLPVCLLRSKFNEDLGQVMFGILGSLEGAEKEGEKKEKKRKNVHLANRRAGWLVDEESCGLVCARVDRGRLRARVIFW